MPKIFNIFGNNNKNKAKGQTEYQETPAQENVDRNCNSSDLETDAVPVFNIGAFDNLEQVNNISEINFNPEIGESYSASAELNVNAVQQYANQSYDSATSSAMTLPMQNANDLAHNSNNTMNVHNAEQQLVMQFSNVSQLHFGSVYNFNGNGIQAGKTNSQQQTRRVSSNSSTSNNRPLNRKTTSIVAMMHSQEEPEHRLLQEIATHLGEGWKLVLRKLGLSEGQIEQGLIDHHMHGGIKEVIYQLLLCWIRNADDNEATVAHITTLLWELKHHECVHRMKIVWKMHQMPRKTS